MNKKTFLAILLTLVMVLSLGTSAFAAEVEQNGTITVKNVTSDTKLELYRILTYKYEQEEDGTTSSTYKVVFTNDDYKKAFIEAINAVDPSAALGTDAKASDIMLWFANNETKIDNLTPTLVGKLEAAATENATYYYNSTSDKSNEASFENSDLVFKDITMGYYLILDKTGDTPGEPPKEHYNSVVMLQPMEPEIEVYLKSNYYTPPTKEISLTEGGTNGDYDKCVDVSIDDDVYFKITATVPKKPITEGATGEKADPAEYTYVLTDTMTEGLDPVTDMDKITIALFRDGQPVTDLDPTIEAVKKDGGTDGSHGFTITLTEKNSEPGDKLVITYSTTISASAEFGNIENTITDSILQANKASGVSVHAHTHEFVVDKDNEYGEPLVGVTFRLQDQEYTSGNQIYYTFVKDTSVTKTNSYTYTGKSNFALDESAKDNDPTLLTTGADGQITINGFKAGTYQLEEISTLTGYNKITELKDVTIHETEKCTDNSTPDVPITECEDDVPTVTVINKIGIELPRTGGAGTALFPIIGVGVLLLAALFLYLNRKRIFGK